MDSTVQDDIRHIALLVLYIVLAVCLAATFTIALGLCPSVLACIGGQ